MGISLTGAAFMPGWWRCSSPEFRYSPWPRLPSHVRLGKVRYVASQEGYPMFQIKTLLLVAAVFFATSVASTEEADPAWMLLVEDAAKSAMADLTDAPANAVSVTILDTAPVSPGDRVIDTLAGGGTALRVATRASSPFATPLNLTFFVMADRDPIQIVPSIPGSTRTRPGVQMELAPDVQRAAAERAGVLDTCNRDRDMPIIDTIATATNEEGGWEEIWKVRLCSGAIEWVTVRFDAPVWTVWQWEVVR